MGKMIVQEQLGYYRWRYEQAKIVVARGSFDGFTLADAHLLKEAKKRGDLLFVGVHTDRAHFCRTGRFPCFPAKERCKVLLGMPEVDYVFLYPDATFETSLRMLRPDLYVFFKGETPPEARAIALMQQKVEEIEADTASGWSAPDSVQQESSS